ncbi:uncharacterized protein LOC134678253 [Cydia fagiglandana]|uniref:uncharacterized protein LOC134678253 n=1 Tax=Cydia fagiglandana TaxID=1458189 RepID=UPI002FEE07A5
MVLTLDGLWGCVGGTDTDTTNDGRALAKMCLACEPHLYVIDDEETAEILLEEFTALVSSLETANLTSTLTSEVVKTRLLQEDHRRSQCNCNTTDNLAFMATRKKKTNNNICTCCQNCQKIGHCFEKKREEMKKTGQEHTMSAPAYSATHSKEYVLDSGASALKSGDLSLLHDAKNKKCVITVANGQQLNSVVIGKAFISPELTLNVPYVPNLGKNLMSVSEITKSGYVVVLSNNYCNSNSTICQITGNQSLIVKNELFKSNVDVQTGPDPLLGNSMSLYRQGSTSANAAAAVPFTWHKHLGVNHGMSVLGGGHECCVVFQAEDGVMARCIACLTWKMCDTSFPQSSAERAANLLHLVLYDCAGLVLIPSWGGAQYLLTSTNDKLRCIFSCFLKKKSERRMRAQQCSPSVWPVSHI